MLIASYTDSDGLNTTVDALITVTDQPDQWAPIVIYPSNNLEFELDPCDIGGVAVATFEVTATDNCDGELVPNVISVPAVAGIQLVPSLGGQEYIVMAAPGIYNVRNRLQLMLLEILAKRTSKSLLLKTQLHKRTWVVTTTLM